MLSLVQLPPAFCSLGPLEGPFGMAMQAHTPWNPQTRVIPPQSNDPSLLGKLLSVPVYTGKDIGGTP